MVYVSKEINKQNLDIPLMIGGATTSRAHSAVKIAPNYEHTVVHVNDASRAVTVVGNLLQENNKDFKNQIREEYDKFRTQFLNRTKKKAYVSIEEARKNKFKIDWDEVKIIKPLSPITSTFSFTAVSIIFSGGTITPKSRIS